jgi:hypothetical protein
MKTVCTFLMLLFSVVIQAQVNPTVDTVVSVALDTTEEYVYKEPSKASQAYHKYRMVSTEPHYSLAKIKKLIKGIKANDESDMVLPAKQFNALSGKEKLTYCMLHAEAYSQNCDVSPPVQEEQKKIFAQLEDAFDEEEWSARQTSFLKKNKDSVMSWLQECITKKNRMGLNFKRTLVEINAIEMIPFLVEFYKKARKDHDILTVLLLFMENGKFQPHLKSTLRKKLYGNNEYHSYVTLNEANADLICKRAMEYYNAKK